MPNPGQPILDTTGRPCLTTTGTPIVADAGGSASCACGACSTYYKADYCSPGECVLVTSVYFCTTTRAECCNAGGCPGAPNRTAQIGDVAFVNGRCFRVNSLTVYAREDLPDGARILTFGPQSNESLCLGPPYFACSDCPEINGYVACNLACACGGTQGGGGLPPGGIYISCAELRWFYQNCLFCPIFKVEWPVGSGHYFCVMPDFNVPTQPSLPPGAVEVGGCGYYDCCQCCSGDTDPSLPQYACCSCDSNGPTGCRSTTYTLGSPPTVIPYGCCWKKNSWTSAGGGLRSDYFAAFPNNPFRTIEMSVSGNVATYLIKTFDPSTGALLLTQTEFEPLTSDPCGFFPTAERMTNSFPQAVAAGNHGRKTTQCDLLKWNYVNDNTPTGGQKTVSRGAVSIVPTDVGSCNANPCQSFSFGSGDNGCANCFTLALGVSVEDLEDIVS